MPTSQAATTVDLICLDPSEPIEWPLGRVWRTARGVAELSGCLEGMLRQTAADAVLFWDPALGAPDSARILEALGRPGDLWHAGLRLGQGGRPALIDFVHPTWMLNCDPSPEIEATSWRLSLRACLIRTAVLRRLGGPSSRFRSLDGAALELGHRCVTRGALPRHLPWLLPADVDREGERLPVDDELRFISYRMGRRWAAWALGRAILSGKLSIPEASRAWRRVRRESRPSAPPPYRALDGDDLPATGEARVSVLIPSLDRYPHLFDLLDQLRQQTVPPCEILVVDQTSVERRQEIPDRILAGQPIRVLYRDQPGQCTARNAGIRIARGDFILFLDDDEAVEPDLIARHLASLARFQAEVSSGVAEEVGAGPLPDHFRWLRLSDVFPTGNTLIHKSVLRGSGLFDLAYDRGARADGDLGMRVYLSGALMILNPAISVLHFHAPRGGLRRHRARSVTYASSRRRLLHRQVPSPTEIYLARRYFTPRQVREMLWLSAAGTLKSHRGTLHQLAKLIVGALLLPDTVRRIRKSCRTAEAMLCDYPQIEGFEASPNPPCTSCT